MMFSLIYIYIFYLSAMDGYSKRSVGDVSFEICQLFKIFSNMASWKSRDVLTQYVYFKMLRTMSFLCVTIFDSAPYSVLKL